MDQSFVCGRNVRTPGFGVILGIFVLINSGFSNVVSQDEVYREAVTEGYLIEGFFLSPRSTALPKSPETAEESQKPSSQSKDSEVFDERPDALHNVSTTERVQLHQSSRQPFTETENNVEGNADFMFTATQSGSGTQNPNLKTTESSPFEGSGDITDLVLRTTENSQFEGSGDTPDLGFTTTESSPFEGSGETINPVLRATENSTFEGSADTIDLVLTTTESSPFEGSGDTVDLVSTTTESSLFEGSGHTLDLVFRTTQTYTTVVMQGDIEGLATSSVSSVSTTVSPESTSKSKADPLRVLRPPIMHSSFANELGQSAETKNPHPGKVDESSAHQNDRTPGWIIIVAFIVGVAALVMLCVAIATKDKWNGPNQAPQLEKKTSSPNQQSEVEMETFLQKDHPRENGEAEEYTVIQLDDLPEKYSSD